MLDDVLMALRELSELLTTTAHHQTTPQPVCNHADVPSLRDLPDDVLRRIFTLMGLTTSRVVVSGSGHALRESYFTAGYLLMRKRHEPDSTAIPHSPYDQAKYDPANCNYHTHSYGLAHRQSAWEACLSEVGPLYQPDVRALAKHPPWRDSACADALYAAVPDLTAAAVCKEWRTLMLKHWAPKVAICTPGERPPESTQVLVVILRSEDGPALRMARLSELENLRALIIWVVPPAGYTGERDRRAVPVPPIGLTQIRHLVYVNMPSGAGMKHRFMPSHLFAPARSCTNLQTLSLPPCYRRSAPNTYLLTQQLVHDLQLLQSFDAPTFLGPADCSAGHALRSLRIGIKAVPLYRLDVSPLSVLHSLTSLCVVRHCPEDCELEGIGQLTNLRILELEGRLLMQRLTQLTALSELEHLLVRHSPYVKKNDTCDEAGSQAIVTALSLLAHERPLPRLSLALASTGQLREVDQLTTLEELTLTMYALNSDDEQSYVRGCSFDFTTCDMLLMAELRTLTQLTALYVEDADVDEFGSEAIATLTELRTLELIYTIDRKPAALRTLVHLHTLRHVGDAFVYDLSFDTYDTNLVGAMRLPQTCPQLRVLYTAGWPTALEDSQRCLSDVCELTALKELSVFRAELQDEDLRQLGFLSSLRSFHLRTGAPRLTTAGLQGLSACTSLRFLCVGELCTATTRAEVVSVITGSNLRGSAAVDQADDVMQAGEGNCLIQ